MEAGAIAVPDAREAPVTERVAQRVGLLYVVTGLALFAVMGVLGLAMRLSQGDVITLSPSWFYRIMTLHGAGMLVGALLAQMGAMWYAVRGAVTLGVGRAVASHVAIVVGAVLVLLATLVGGFAPGWTFLYPLPFVDQGAWGSWSTTVFLVGLVIVGAGFTVYCVDILARVTATYGSLARALGIRFLRGRDDDPPPPQAIGATVVAVAGLVSSAVGVTILAALLGRLLDASIVIDALWAKNLTYFFGHTYANLIIYLAVGAVYVLVPRFAGRSWKTTKPIAIGWLATLTFVLTAYGHHLYMDFVQPVALAAIGTASSSAAALPVLVVTIYTGMMLVWGSGYRWTFASTLLYLGFAGWVIGGTGAVVDSMIPVNFRLHNTLWVPAHFHTYLLLGVMFWAMAFAAHCVESAAGSPVSRRGRTAALLPMVVGGYGLVGVWYVSGALGVPRRYAVQPFGSSDYSLVGAIFALVFAAGFAVFVAVVLLHWRRAPVAGAAGAGAADPPVLSGLAGTAPGRPVFKTCEIAGLAMVSTVAFVSLVPTVVEAAETSVRWHHLAHAAMFLAGAAGALALVGIPDVWGRVRAIPPSVGLALAVLAPAVSLLAMTPRFYGGLEERPALHFGYHILFFVGLGAVTSFGASRLGRPAAWTLVVLSVGMSVLYAAGVIG
jgi:cytochrome c oxidase subunit 1